MNDGCDGHRGGVVVDGDLRIMEIARSHAQTSAAQHLDRNVDDKCLCWTGADGLLNVLDEHMRAASPHRTTRHQLRYLRRRERPAAAERPAVLAGFAPAAAERPPVIAGFAPAHASAEGRGGGSSTRRVAQARSPSPRARAKGAASEGNNTSSTTSHSRRAPQPPAAPASTDFVPEPRLETPVSESRAPRERFGLTRPHVNFNEAKVTMSLAHLGSMEQSESSDFSYFSQLSRRGRRPPPPAEPPCSTSSEQSSVDAGDSWDAAALLAAAAGPPPEEGRAAEPRPVRSVKVPELASSGREDLEMDFYWLPSPPGTSAVSARRKELDSYQTMRQDPLAAAILRRFMQRDSSNASSQLEVQSVDLTNKPLGGAAAPRLSPPPPSRSDSRRTRAILARFMHRVEVAALVRGVRGMKLMNGFSLNLCAGDSAPPAAAPESVVDSLRVSCGPKAKIYALADLKTVDYSPRAVELARAATLNEGKLQARDWPRDVTLQNAGEIVVCYFARHSIPVILVFENVSDRQDFVEVLTVLMGTLRNANAQFIWQAT